ncbi:MAG: hypothetical protein HQK53_10130 [Oligoflexia bacterium]|nr:hypothetical protein [Oligoflexia bacterium]
MFALQQSSLHLLFWIISFFSLTIGYSFANDAAEMASYWEKKTAQKSEIRNTFDEIKVIMSDSASCKETYLLGDKPTYLADLRFETTSARKFPIDGQSDAYKYEGVTIKSYAFGTPKIIANKFQGSIDFTINFDTKVKAVITPLSRTMTLYFTTNEAGSTDRNKIISCTTSSGVIGGGGGGAFTMQNGVLSTNAAPLLVTQALPNTSAVGIPEGAMVYNTNTANGMTKGLYVSDGTNWIKVQTAGTNTTGTKLKDGLYEVARRYLWGHYANNRDGIPYTGSETNVLSAYNLLTAGFRGADVPPLQPGAKARRIALYAYYSHQLGCSGTITVKAAGTNFTFGLISGSGWWFGPNYSNEAYLATNGRISNTGDLMLQMVGFSRSGDCSGWDKAGYFRAIEVIFLDDFNDGTSDVVSVH